MRSSTKVEVRFGSKAEEAGFDTDGQEARLGSETEEVGFDVNGEEARLGSETEGTGFDAKDEEARFWSKTMGAGFDADDKERGGNVPMMFGSFLTITILLMETSPCTRLQLLAKKLSSIRPGCLAIKQ